MNGLSGRNMKVTDGMRELLPETTNALAKLTKQL
jgi:hypothetical protein